MKSVCFFIVLVVAFCSAAEPPAFNQRMKIHNAGDLYSTYDIVKSVASNDLRRLFGEGYRDMIKHSVETGWPSGMSTLNGRTQNKKLIEDLVAYKVMEFGDYVILVIPAKENAQLPSEVKAAYDYYMVFNARGVNAYKEPPLALTNGNGIPAMLLSTDGLRSTYNLAEDEYTGEIQKQLGAEYDQVIAASQEHAWPPGIANMDARDLVRPEMLKYKVWMIAEFDDIYILRIPAAENTFMPESMRPAKDIYFTIDSKDVKLLE